MWNITAVCASIVFALIGCTYLGYACANVKNNGIVAGMAAFLLFAAACFTFVWW